MVEEADIFISCFREKFHLKIEEGQKMAHKKGVGSSSNGRDSIAKRLGVKNTADK